LKLLPSSCINSVGSCCIHKLIRRSFSKYLLDSECRR
jgi:hypothetical protein